MIVLLISAKKGEKSKHGETKKAVKYRHSRPKEL